MELLGKGDQLKDWAADGFLIDMVYHFRCSRDSPFFEYTGAIHRGPHDISSAPFLGGQYTIPHGRRNSQSKSLRLSEH